MNDTAHHTKPHLLMRALQTFQRRRVGAAFLAGALLSAGLAGGMSALASESSPMAWHHAASSADMQAHVNAVLGHLDTELGLSDAQKAQVHPLVMQALKDLRPMHEELHRLHAQVQPLLMQTPIDRSALEALRVQHLQLLDQASKRVTQLMADVDDQLTPEQRQKLWTHLSQMHGASHAALQGWAHGHGPSKS
jgi:Spy/CpxP family protein refolding chaperone